MLKRRRMETLEQEYLAYSDATIVVNKGLGCDMSCSKTISACLPFAVMLYL